MKTPSSSRQLATAVPPSSTVTETMRNSVSQTSFLWRPASAAAPTGAASAGAVMRPYLTVLAMVKMGRYIAIMKYPTVPPRKTIMSGSMAAVSEPTATSTSSS